MEPLAIYIYIYNYVYIERDKLPGNSRVISIEIENRSALLHFRKGNMLFPRRILVNPPEAFRGGNEGGLGVYFNIGGPPTGGFFFFFPSSYSAQCRSKRCGR